MVARAAALIALALAPATQTYAFTEASDVSYTLTHWLTTTQGRSHRITGRFQVQGDELVLPLTFDLPLEGLAAGEAAPVATLALKRVDMAWKTLKDGQAGARLDFKGTAHGDVTLRGIARPVTAAIEGWTLPLDAHLTARFAVAPTTHGVPMPRFWFIPFDDRIEIEVEAVACRPAP